MLSFCLPAILASFLISSIPQSLASSISKVEALNERDDWNVLLRTFDLDNTKDARNVVIDELKNVVYVGAVDYLYALDLDNIETIKKKMYWGPDEKSFEMCDLFEPNPELCRNAIRILHSVNDTHLYACGTNALEPRCIYVNKQTFRQEGNSISGTSKSPADPFSVTVSTMTGGSLFTAINPNSQSKNGMVAKSPANSEQDVLTTNELDNFWLSDPRFVSMFTVPEVYSEEQKIVVLFKENAEEIPLEILTQDSDYSVNLVYSRLATICANDRGGRQWFSLDKQLATFSKMRIACPVSIESPGKSRAMPFFYDEIQSTYVIPNPQEPDNPSIYAIFKTPKGAHQATATCVYAMRDIQRSMNTYKFWNKPSRTEASAALYSTYTIPDYPPPGSCAGDTTQFSKERANYGNAHPLKFGMIKPKDGFAIYQDSGIAYSHIIVDRIQRKEKIPGGMSSLLVEKEYDVVHYITESGFIKRVVFSVEDRSVHWEIPSRNLFNDSNTEDSVLSVKKGDNGFIYFGTTSSVLQLRIASCSAYSTCGECRLANDPYCEWDGDLDIACKEIDFSTKIHKKPLTLITKQNETGCRISDSNDHKKHESNQNQVVSGESGLKKQNEALINQAKVLNQTILRLEKEKLELKSELAANVVELYNWYNNYTQLSSLLLQYNQRLKLISQLYRDTAYALNKCQGEKSSKNLELKNANVQLKAHKTASSKCKKEKRAAEQAPCKCTQTSGTTSSATGASSRTLRVPVSKSLGVDRNAPSVCQSRVDKLQSQIVAILQTKHNMTKQIKQLNRTIDNLKNENAKIIASTTGKKECAGRDQWISYLPTNKLFLITQASVTFAKAQQDCALLGGSVADLKDDGEARFIFNVTHSLYPRKRYWVGLRKYTDSVRWLDGSAFDETVTPRFSRSQDARLKSRIQYCVETLHRVGIWQLLPCSRHRRVICVKDDGAEIR